MEFKTKYSLGDEVWIIKKSSDQQSHECFECEGSGRLSLKTVTEGTECPVCYGVGRKYDKIIVRVEAVSGGNVGLVRAEKRVDDTASFYEKEVLQLSGTLQKVEYMLTSTGVGSGTVWQETDLYPDFESANNVAKQLFPLCS